MDDMGGRMEESGVSRGLALSIFRAIVDETARLEVIREEDHRLCVEGRMEFGDELIHVRTGMTKLMYVCWGGTEDPTRHMKERVREDMAVLLVDRYNVNFVRRTTRI